MDRETWILLALGMLFAAGLVVSFAAWVLLIRDRRARRRAKQAARPASGAAARGDEPP